jgi:hypothetical protein
VRISPGAPRFLLATSTEVIDPREGMGLALWYFLCARPGELRPLPLAQVDAFFSSGGRLPDDNGVVRYLEVVVQFEDRKAVEVLRITGSQHRVIADGTLDRQHLGEVMALAGEAALGGVLAFKRPGVIDAEHRFARRRLEHVGPWKPSQVELALLRTLVNRKAGRTIM